MLILCTLQVSTGGHNFSLPFIYRLLFRSEAGLYFSESSFELASWWTIEVSAMSADDCTRDKSLGIMLARERGVQVRSKWERYKKLADKYREGGDVVMELYHCKLLADG